MAVSTPLDSIVDGSTDFNTCHRKLWVHQWGKPAVFHLTSAGKHSVNQVLCKLSFRTREVFHPNLLDEILQKSKHFIIITCVQCALVSFQQVVYV